MIPDQHLRALKIISEKLAGKDIQWALVGSSSQALQGVDTEVHDIDLLTTKEGAIEMGRILKEFEQEPVKYSETPNFKSYHGILSVSGVKVEIMGDMQSKSPEGIWSAGNRLSKLIHIKIRDFAVPALDLKSEYHAYLNMGRVDKAKKIKETLDKNKPKDDF